MTRLQTLWGLFARQARLDAKDREARIGWVAGAIGRQLASFKELTAEEARKAIDAIQKHLPAELLTKLRAPRGLARAYGTAGRRGGANKEVRLADAASLELVARLRDQLGWTQERLDTFLLSPKSPLRKTRRDGGNGRAIRTLADANKVIWVLKSFLRRAR